MKTQWLAAAIFVSAMPLLATAETTNCTPIQSLPHVISAPGVYCLNSDLTTSISSGNAITINANNVTIDLNGWRLGGGLAGTATQANGIYALDRQNITIRNGTVRGYYAGVFLDELNPLNSRGHLVEDIRADQNRHIGIRIRGQRNLLRRNQVLATGGSTAVPNDDVYGIIVEGMNNRILDNDIIDTQNTGNGGAYGMLISFGRGTVIADNRVSEVVGSAVEIGVFLNGSAYAVVRNNSFSDSAHIPSSSSGIYVDSNSSGVVVVGNQVTGFVNGLSLNTAGIQRSGNVVGGATNPANGVGAITY